MNAEAMNEARFVLPSGALKLVCELVKQLGGQIVETNCEKEIIYVHQPMKEKERIGRMLKGLRLRAGLTQKELGSKINVPQNHISDYEKNKRSIPKAKAKDLARILETVESDFLPR